MNRVLCLLIALAGMGCGCSPAPSIVGKWRTEWDFVGAHLVETIEFLPGGRFRIESEGEKPGDYRMEETAEGMYTLTEGALEITRTSAVTVTTNLKTGKTRTTRLSEPKISRWSRAKLTADTLTLGPPEGTPTGSRDTVFQRIR